MKTRFVVKKTRSPGRGGGPSIEEYYVFDTERRTAATATCPFKPDVDKLCELYNQMHLDNVFEKEVLGTDSI